MSRQKPSEAGASEGAQPWMPRPPRGLSDAVRCAGREDGGRSRALRRRVTLISGGSRGCPRQSTHACLAHLLRRCRALRRDHPHRHIVREGDRLLRPALAVRHRRGARTLSASDSRAKWRLKRRTAGTLAFDDQCRSYSSRARRGQARTKRALRARRSISTLVMVGQPSTMCPDLRPAPTRSTARSKLTCSPKTDPAIV
jgi:hypothetical protein